MIGRWHCTDQTIDTQFSFYLEKSRAKKNRRFDNTAQLRSAQCTDTDLSDTIHRNAAHTQVMSVERVHSFAKNGHCILVTNRSKKKSHFTYTIVSMCVCVPFLILSNFRFFYSRNEKETFYQKIKLVRD